jgi:hypothetical protein
MRKIAATASTGSAAVIATVPVAGLTGAGPGRSFRFGTGIRNLQQQKKDKYECGAEWNPTRQLCCHNNRRLCAVQKFQELGSCVITKLKPRVFVPLWVRK